MNDYLVKALGFNGQVRAYAVRTTETVQEAQRRHDTWRTASAALGRTMTAGVMMGAMQNGEVKLNIRVEGDGPLGLILVDANAHGDVRGYVKNPHTDLEAKSKGKLNVGKAVGANGTLSVIRDLGLKENFVGQVPLISGELAEDFTYYFTVSEQTPSSVSLGVLVNPDDTIVSAGGFILQMMPGATEEVISFLEDRLMRIQPVTALMAAGLVPEDFLVEVLGKDNVQILETMSVQFRCQCSKERIAGALVTLGKSELQQMIEEDGQAETTCHFCNEHYHFTKAELEALYNNAK